MVLDQLIGLWGHFLGIFDNIPEDYVALTVYCGGAVIALLLWYSVARLLPKPFGAMTWIILFALLCTPTISEGDNAYLAPAAIGLIFGLVTKDQTLILTNVIAMLFVMGMGFLIGFFVHKFIRQRHSS